MDMWDDRSHDAEIKHQFSEQRHIDVPEGVTELGYLEFGGYKKLESISLPSSLKIIGYHAFFGCENLKKIHIPYGVEKINEGAFSECTALRSVEVPDSVTYMHRMVFTDCISLETVKLPSGIDDIPSFTFAGCRSLREVEMPQNLKKVVQNAFQSCTALTELTIPESVEDIEFEAFLNCTSLRRIRIPISLKDCSLSAFKGCTALERIDFYGEFPKNKPVTKWLAEMVFDNRSNAKELLLAAKCITSEMLDTSPKELYLSSVFDVNMKGKLKSRKNEIIRLLMNAEDKTTLNSLLTKTFSGDEIIFLFRAFREYTDTLPKNPEQAKKRNTEASMIAR